MSSDPSGTAVNPDFDPFNDESCWVTRSPRVQVRRDTRLEGRTRSTTFQKTYLRNADVDLTPFSRYENGMIFRLAEDRVERTARFDAMFSDRQGELTAVCTHNQGPSLDSWLKVNHAGPNGERSPHPLGSPKALVHVLSDSLTALGHFHRAGYVHGDVHLGNLCMIFAQPQLGHSAGVAVPNSITLIDFGFSFKRNNGYPPPAALPIQPTAARHSPGFMAALEADYARRDGKANAVLNLDGRIDLHALGLMSGEMLEALAPHWADDSDLAIHARRLVHELIARLTALDADHTRPQAMPDGLHEKLAAPLEQWLRKVGDWAPTPFIARGIRDDVADSNGRAPSPVSSARPTPPRGGPAPVSGGETTTQIPAQAVRIPEMPLPLPTGLSRADQLPTGISGVTMAAAANGAKVSRANLAIGAAVVAVVAIAVLVTRGPTHHEVAPGKPSPPAMGDSPSGVHLPPALPAKTIPEAAPTVPAPDGPAVPAAEYCKFKPEDTVCRSLKASGG